MAYKVPCWKIQAGVDLGGFALGGEVDGVDGGGGQAQIGKHRLQPSGSDGLHHFP